MLDRLQKPISQEHPFGCAVACVAYRCKTDYRRAIEFFEHRDQAWQIGYYCREVVAALFKAGFRYHFALYNSTEHTETVKKNGTIAFVQASSKYPVGHYIIRTPKGWMNPWSNFPQMLPVKSGFQRKPPGKITYLIFEKN